MRGQAGEAGHGPAPVDTACPGWGAGRGMGRLSVAEGISGPKERPGRKPWWACAAGGHGRDSSVLSKEWPGWQGLGAAALDPG